MIEFSGITKTYEGTIDALDGVDLTIDDGDFVFVVGRSGAGKSTLIKLLLKEIEPTSGTVTVNGVNLEKMKRSEIPYYRRTLGVVFQDFRLIPTKTVYDNVAFAMQATGAKQKIIDKRVPKVLDLLGLYSKKDRMPGELSGGEQQRVALARAIINKPDIIIADEPTGNIDPELSYEIVRLLDSINAGGTTVVVVTHAHELVKRFNHRVIVIDKGRIVGDSGQRRRKNNE